MELGTVFQRRLLRELWGVVSGLVIWGELPDALALTGIALIAGSGVAIVVLDQRRGRKEATLGRVIKESIKFPLSVITRGQQRRES